MNSVAAFDDLKMFFVSLSFLFSLIDVLLSDHIDTVVLVVLSSICKLADSSSFYIQSTQSD